MSVLKCQPILLNRHFFFKEWGQRGIRESQGQSERSQRGVREESEGGQNPYTDDFLVSETRVYSL